jgi:hypothetical protein
MPARGLLATGLAALCSVGAMVVPAYAAAGMLSPSPPDVAFPTLAVGTEQSEAVTLENSGTTTTVALAKLEGTDPTQFKVVSAGAEDCEGAVLADTQSCVVDIVFSPTSAGQKEATLIIESDATNSPNLIALTGVALAPEFAISPSPFDFGTVEPGSKSSEQSFSVENVGSESGLVETVALSGVDAGQFQIKADTCSLMGVGEGGKCSVGVVFAPTSPGAKSATLEVPSDDPESPTTVAISGTGASPPPPPAGGGGAPAQAVAPARPSNAFSFGKVIFNKGRGTASLPVRVPGPGVLVLAGKGIVARKGAGAAVELGGAGVARLAIVPAGSKAAALDRSGKAKVVATVTYTPKGGDPLTKSKKIGLRKAGA